MTAAANVPKRVLAFIRTVAPFAYCDACLAQRLETTVADLTAALSALIADGLLERRRRACYGCGRTLELSAPGQGPPR